MSLGTQSGHIGFFRHRERYNRQLSISILVVQATPDEGVSSQEPATKTI
jgi:hypothetical protein